MRFEAAEQGRLFDWPHRFHSFLLTPYSHLLSVPWPVAVSHIPDARGLRCSLFPEIRGNMYPLVLAHLVLNPRELEAWQRLTGPERRRRQWLQGRIAAKDAVRLLLKHRYQVETCYADIEISSNEYGQPLGSGELLAKLGCRFRLSISHSGKVAVALAGECPDYDGVGIDVERVNESHEGLEEGGFGSGERSLLETFGASERKEWFLRLWCAKEAVAKALGRGIMGNPHNLVIQDVDVETGTVNLNIDGQLARELRNYANTSLTAYTGCDETVVFATSLV
jgi:phosphopantetheine--protein transferase-like protein